MRRKCEEYTREKMSIFRCCRYFIIFCTFVAFLIKIVLRCLCVWNFSVVLGDAMLIFHSLSLCCKQKEIWVFWWYREFLILLVMVLKAILLELIIGRRFNVYVMCVNWNLGLKRKKKRINIVLCIAYGDDVFLANDD